LVAALLGVARVTAGLVESNGSLPLGFMTHVTCRLTAKNRDQLQNPTLGNRVRATFTFLIRIAVLMEETLQDLILTLQALSVVTSELKFYSRLPMLNFVSSYTMVWQLKMQEKEKAGVKNVRIENVAQNYGAGVENTRKEKKCSTKSQMWKMQAK